MRQPGSGPNSRSGTAQRMRESNAQTALTGLHEQRTGLLLKLYRRIAGAQSHGNFDFWFGIHCGGVV